MEIWKFLIIYIAGVILLLYLLNIRPGKKKHRMMVELQNRLTPGDVIVTIGGIIGKVMEKDGDTLTIMIDEDNKTTVKVIKYAVQSIVESHTEKEEL